jgi:hypothetical protein
MPTLPGCRSPAEFFGKIILFKAALQANRLIGAGPEFYTIWLGRRHTAPNAGCFHARSLYDTKSNRACAYQERIIKIGIGPYGRWRPWFLQWYHVNKFQEVNHMQNIQHMAQPYDEVEQHSEGKIAKKIEQQTAKLPSDLFMWAALASIGTAFALEVTGHEEKSRFVGQWVAPFLLFGLYNKIVKVAGSDRTH